MPVVIWAALALPAALGAAALLRPTAGWTQHAPAAAATTVLASGLVLLGHAEKLDCIGQGLVGEGMGELSRGCSRVGVGGE